MVKAFELLFNPSDSSKFVGRKKESDRFYEWLSNLVIMKKPDTNWVHISGSPGSGKSSLLKKFREMAVVERVRDIGFDIPHIKEEFPPEFENVFKLLDGVSPDWRSFMQRRRNTELVDFPTSNLELLENGEIPDIFENATSFLETLEKGNTTVGIFIDNLDNTIKYNLTSVVQLIRMVIDKFTEGSTRIFFVTTGGEEVTKLLDPKESECLIFTVGAFESSEAELMLRRLGSIEVEKRSQVASVSNRLPFDLALRYLLFQGGKDFSQLEMDDISEVLELDEEQVSFLEEISKHPKNYFDKKSLKNVNGKLLENLAKRKIVAISDTHFTLTSSAFWIVVSAVFLPTDVRTELLLVLDRVEEQIGDANLPKSKDFDSIKAGLSSIHDKTLLYEIANQITDIASTATVNDLIYASWELFGIMETALQKTGDTEKLGEQCETFGKLFGDVNKDYYAGIAHQKAGEYFSKLGSSKRVRAETNFREAGIRFRKEAESMSVNNFHYALRSILKKSIEAFSKAKETKYTKEVEKMAMELFDQQPEHQKYIKKIGE